MRASLHPRFLRWLGLICTASVAAVAAFNLLIDPYGVWNTPMIEVLNAGKPAELDHEMMFKAAEIARKRPVTLLLGSSRVDIGLDPLHPALVRRGPTYNLGLMGGSMGPLLQYYKHALRFGPSVRHVVMGLDFFAFNRKVVVPTDFDPDRLGHDRLNRTDVIASLLTHKAVSDSFRTVMTSMRFPQFRAYTEGMRTDSYMRQHARDEGMPQRFSIATAFYLNAPDRYADFVLSDEAFADFAEIVRLSREHGIDLQLFMPPEHVVLQEALRVRGLMGAYRTWKARIVAIAPFWDFSGYNSITTEPIDAGMSLYWDASHFRSSVGNLILDRIFGVENPALPADFGRRVTLAEMEGWLAFSEEARRGWEASHGDVIRWVEDRATAP